MNQIDPNARRAQDWVEPREYLLRFERLCKSQQKITDCFPSNASQHRAKQIELASFFASHAGMRLRLIGNAELSPSVYGFFDDNETLRAQFKGFEPEMAKWSKAMAEALTLGEGLNSHRQEGLSKRL